MGNYQAEGAGRLLSNINDLPLRSKINLAVALIFALVIIVVTTHNVLREKNRMMEMIETQAKDLTTLYFDSLNTMMLTGTMDQRKIFRKKMLSRDGVVDARVIRGEPVIQQFGPGEAGETAVDDLDMRALRGEEVIQVRDEGDRRIITVITPFQATKDTRGVNCLQCHEVAEGAVNGAVRVSMSLKEMDEAVTKELYISIISNFAAALFGLLMLNLVLKSSVIKPLAALIGVMKEHSEGKTSARAPVQSRDEIGQLSMAFNEMSDSMDEAAQREHELMLQEQAAAIELKSKVDSLLRVVNRVAHGDLEAQVEFSGTDAIGELAKQLQIMIDQIRDAIEEKRKAMESLQQRVDAMLAVVSRAADGDMTGRIKIEGNDALSKLAAGFQSMIERLNDLVAQVQTSGIQVASAATAISATAKEQEATVAEQAATTNEIVTTATEISATAKELLKTMDEVTHVAGDTAQSAAHGRDSLGKMESTIHQVVEAVRTIGSKFEVINEKASNISTVVTTITKVADQTNLLSLNAAIEAEKAGEFGLGFSVVAKEIRRLADQTAVATLDIEQMVKEMQAAVASGVMSMERFSEQVRHSVNDVGAISQQLNKIIEQAQALLPRFVTVHQGMQFQAEGADQINQSMIQLNEAAQQTVESIRESNIEIGKLNQAAMLLQVGVTRFKV
ncbi:MAG: methyl-accepting chemotaxis protein [Pseudomonadota bacterium]